MFVFRLSEHLDRLQDSISIMRMDAQITNEAFTDSLLETMRVNGYEQDVHIRLSVWVAGEGPMDCPGPTEWMCAVLPRPERSLESRACKGQISSWYRIDDRSMPPRVKSAANYNNGRLANMQAKADGYDEAILMGPDGKMSEGTGACLFMVRGGRVFTPPVTSGILESVTRTTLIALFADTGMPVTERVIDRTELYVAEEAFLCGSGYEVTPLISIDRHPLGGGKVGPVTRKIWADYEAVVRGKVPARRDWLTAVGSATTALPSLPAGNKPQLVAAR
jgi:branched-chain amino acid aminotransferase